MASKNILNCKHKYYRNGAGPFGSGDLLEAFVHTYAVEKGW